VSSKLHRCSLLFFLVGGATAQDVPNQPESIQKSLKVPRIVCPGDPAGNLASVDCSYSGKQRLLDFVTSSVTDQAALGAVFFGLVAEARHDPAQLKRDWVGLGYRVGSRYGQNLAKGITELGVGAIMQVDPRHITYASDPRVQKHQSGLRPRVLHAFMDWLTVRRSSPNGGGRPLPNVPLFAGAAASGFSGYAWYPSPLATPKEAALRAGSSLGTALAASFYTEFQPEVGRLLGAIFRRRTSPTP
jgi:hypothetical protein